MLTENHIKEGLSKAYVLAVAHRAGISCTLRDTDYGIDGTFHEVKTRGGRRVESGVALDFQAKASTRCSIEEARVLYDLEAKSHRDLVDEEARTPRILIVLALPDEPGDWLLISPDELVMKRCAFWTSLRGHEPTANEHSQRIQIPRTNLFNVEALQAMMRRIKQMGLP